MATLTGTSYAVLGLLDERPHTAYELAKRMRARFGDVWPRATSNVYEEPKKLLVLGLAKAKRRSHGRRQRTVYSISRKGRRALQDWLRTPGALPLVEFEAALQVCLAQSASKDELLKTLRSVRNRAEQFRGDFRLKASSERSWQASPGTPLDALAYRFTSELWRTVAEWARWAEQEAMAWRSLHPKHTQKTAIDVYRRALS